MKKRGAARQIAWRWDERNASIVTTENRGWRTPVISGRFQISFTLYGFNWAIINLLTLAFKRSKLLAKRYISLINMNLFIHIQWLLKANDLSLLTNFDYILQVWQLSNRWILFISNWSYKLLSNFFTATAKRTDRNVIKRHKFLLADVTDVCLRPCLIK